MWCVLNDVQGIHRGVNWNWCNQGWKSWNSGDFEGNEDCFAGSGSVKIAVEKPMDKAFQDAGKMERHKPAPQQRHVEARDGTPGWQQSKKRDRREPLYLQHFLSVACSQRDFRGIRLGAPAFRSSGAGSDMTAEILRLPLAFTFVNVRLRSR
jgi:hypothetical protein